jgi:hypothetical protein
MMRLRLLILALILLAFPIALAEPQIEIHVTPIDNFIDWNGTATYNLVVRNLQSTGDTLRLRPATFEWGQMVFDENQITVPAGGFEQVSVKLFPPRDVSIGTYAVEVAAFSSTTPGLKGSSYLKLNVVSELPKVEPDWGFGEELNPGERSITLILKNQGTTAVGDITAVLQSPFEAPITLDAGNFAKGEAKVGYVGNLNIPLNTPVGDYSYRVLVSQDGWQINTYEKRVKILPKPAVDVAVTEESGFLGKTFTASITNVGNVLASDTYSVNLPRWQTLFLYSKNSHDYVTGAVAGTIDTKWPYSLDIGESTSVVYKVSFVPILGLLIALLIIFYSLAWYLKQDLSISKEIVEVNKVLKVKVIVKNNSQRPRHNVLVVDELPTPLKITRDFTTVNPKAIKKGRGVVQLVWKFDNIWPGEEKVLAYGIKSALPLMGNVLLPSAKIKTKNEKKEAKIYLSNQVAVPSRVEVIEDNYKPSE